MKSKKKSVMDRKKQLIVIGAITAVALIAAIILALTSCGAGEE